MFLPNFFSRHLSGPGIRAIALRGSAWTTIGFGLQYGIRLVSTLATTRLLMPEVFGLMSLAMVFQMAVALMSDVGTIPSVIRSPRGDEPSFLNTAWSIQATRGLGIGLVLCLLAWPISLIYDEPVLFPLLCVLSVTSVIDGCASISIAVCRRKLDLGHVTMLTVLGQLSATIFTIIAAWLLHSVWALAIGSIAGSLTKFILSYTMLPAFWPRFGFEKRTVDEILTFGRWVLLATLLTYFGGQGNRAFMGFLVPLDTLGFVTIATTLSWSLGNLVSNLLGNVAFPALSRIARQRPADLPAGLKKVQRTILLAIIPVFVLLSLLAQPLVDLLYDDRYAEAGQYLRLFALNGSITIMSMPYQNAMLALGNSRIHALVMGCNAGFRILGLVAGFHIAGVYGMITGLGVGSALTFLVSAMMARRQGIANPLMDVAALLPVLIIYAVTFMTLHTG